MEIIWNKERATTAGLTNLGSFKELFKGMKTFPVTKNKDKRITVMVQNDKGETVSVIASQSITNLYHAGTIGLPEVYGMNVLHSEVNGEPRYWLGEDAAQWIEVDKIKAVKFTPKPIYENLI